MISILVFEAFPLVFSQILGLPRKSLTTKACKQGGSSRKNEGPGKMGLHKSEGWVNMNRNGGSGWSGLYNQG